LGTNNSQGDKMNNRRFLFTFILIVAILAVLLVAGCGSSKSQNTEDTGWYVGVLRSTDHGASWTSVGNARFDNIGPVPVDPTALLVDGRIVLYFVDFLNLDRGVLYRTSSKDGVRFDEPEPVYDHGANMMDPFVLRLADGTLRMYASQEPVGIISATSRDGTTFTSDNGVRASGMGGMAGALLLPDGRVRLFLDGVPLTKGIDSMISDDALNFTLEGGLRIAMPPDYMTINNPQPIHLAEGGYVMLYQTQDKQHEGREEWQAELHLATSEDGFVWNPNPKILGYGGTSCIIEKPNGALFMYVGSYLPPED
jgi:hypothetical protein